MIRRYKERNNPVILKMITNLKHSKQQTLEFKDAMVRSLKQVPVTNQLIIRNDQRCHKIKGISFRNIMHTLIITKMSTLLKYLRK